jgi:hypothetical protein
MLLRGEETVVEFLWRHIASISHNFNKRVIFNVETGKDKPCEF